MSGLALALVALLAFRAGAPWSTLLLSGGAGVMLWEFHRMVAGMNLRHAFEPVLVAIAGAGVVYLHGFMGFSVSLPVLAGLSVALAVTRRGLWAGVGFAYIALSVLALVSLLATPGDGFALVVWLILVVVAADVGGYFAGRIFGGPKLWPAVSPKKTWSGAVGGWVLAVVVGIFFSVVTGAPMAQVLLYTVVLAMVSQMGDLLESVAKRRFGVKDSGHFLPGHGGALDRFDGLMAAALAAAVLGLGPGLFQG